MPEVWIFNHYAGYPENVPATRTYELTRRLAASGWDVTVVACSFNHYTFVDDYPNQHGPIREEMREGVRWVFVKGAAYRSNGAARFRNMADYATRAYLWGRRRPPPDIIVGTTVHPLAAEAARRLAKTRKTKFVYEITDLWPESLVDLGHITRKSSIYRLMRGLERRAFIFADGVVGILPGIPEYAWDAHGLTLTKFCYVPNGTEISQVVGDTTAPQPDTIAYIGGFAPAHGMPSIVRAAIRLNQHAPGRFNFNLYGDGPTRPAMEALAVDYPNIRFQGLIPKSQVQGHLSRNSLCLCTAASLPVHRYGISFNKLFDYFKAERPIVFAVDSGNDPVSASGAGLSVPAGDVYAISEAILTLCNMSLEERNTMGRRGQEFLRREHDFDVLSDRLRAFFCNMGETDRAT